jgi:hypothetical protein
MTQGHWHRHVSVRKGSRVYQFLRSPLFTSTNLKRVENSRFVWGDCGGGLYYLSLLGILHPLTGLTIKTKD